jgi:heme A synthase
MEGGILYEHGHRMVASHAWLAWFCFSTTVAIALGAIWHICGSNIVTYVVLWIAVRILLHYSDHPALRKTALALLGITFVQVFLGIAAYMSRIATLDAPQPMPVMNLSTVLHVAAGAISMAASALAAVQARRNVRRPAHHFAPQGVAIA